MRIDLCICTYRRPHIAETLRSVAAATRPEGVDLRVIVIDNDAEPSGKCFACETSDAPAPPVRYLHAPGANISLARNAGLAASDAGWIAFLDDDEVVDAGWLTALVARQRETGADAVFGQAMAIYAPGAPAWMVAGDFHSQRAVTRGGVVETGHTCNALLRWRGSPWQGARFDLARGRSGGEDTEFFFRLHRMGAQYAIADRSVVREAVEPARATLGWLLARRFRIGQSYAARAVTVPQRAALFGPAAAKAAWCHLRAGLSRDAGARAFWLLRGRMHAGVCAGCLGLAQRALYGGAP